MNSRKPILFVDFDGTICHDKYWRSLPSQNYEAIQSLLFGNDKTRVNDWMLGKYTAEEINQFVCDKTGIPYADLWGMFVNDCATMRVPKELLSRLSAQREIFKTVLITGNMDSFSRFTVPELKLVNYFDCVSNSYDEGKHKTDNGGEIFVEYAEKYQVALTECILIDDSPGACSLFDALGGNSLLITSEKDIAFYLSKLEETTGPAD